jgi:hypothetical protein
VSHDSTGRGPNGGPSRWGAIERRSRFSPEWGLGTQALEAVGLRRASVAHPKLHRPARLGLQRPQALEPCSPDRAVRRARRFRAGCTELPTMTHFRTSVVQRPGSDLTLLAGIGRIAGSSRFERLDAHFAFATATGVADLTLVLDQASRETEGRFAAQRWLLSLDFGHTEPEALEMLLALPHSQVRVMDGSYLLRRGLRPRRSFHPKTLVLAAGRLAPVAAYLGSGNLTRSGLRFGNEHGMLSAVAHPANELERREAALLRGHLRQMRRVWDDAEHLSASMLGLYRQLRLDRPPSVQNETETQIEPRGKRVDGLPPEQVVALRRDRRFWVETGNMYTNLGPGDSGNQLDLKRGTRAYFGFSASAPLTSSHIGKTTLVFRDQRHERNLRFGDNSMDKIDLPVLSPRVDYVQQTVMFTRRRDRAFECELLSPAAAAEVKAKSVDRGTAYAMAGDRRYGTLS